MLFTCSFSIILPRHRRRGIKKRKRATLNSSKKNWNSRRSLHSYLTNDSTFKMMISNVMLRGFFCRIQEERDERHRLKGRVSRFEPLPTMEGKRSCKFFLVFFSHQNSQFHPMFTHGVRPSQVCAPPTCLGRCHNSAVYTLSDSGNKIHTAFLLLLADGSSRRNRPSSGNFVLYTV